MPQYTARQGSIKGVGLRRGRHQIQYKVYKAVKLNIRSTIKITPLFSVEADGVATTNGIFNAETFSTENPVNDSMKVVIEEIYWEVVSKDEAYNAGRYSLVVSDIVGCDDDDTLNVDEYVENIIGMAAPEQYQGVARYYQPNDTQWMQWIIMYYPILHMHV